MTDAVKAQAPLWIGLLTGPLVWFFHMEANFALVEWACPNHDWILHVVSAVSLLLVAIAGLIAGREWREPPGVPRSGQYMAVLGMVLSAGFFLVILAQEIPTWVLTPCQ
jgi:hypothetical protein